MQSLINAHLRSRSMDDTLLHIKNHQVNEASRGRTTFGQYHYLFPILKKYDDKFHNYMRMSLPCFEYISQHINESCTRNWCNFHTQPIAPEEKLVVTLR